VISKERQEGISEFLNQYLTSREVSRLLPGDFFMIRAFIAFVHRALLHLIDLGFVSTTTPLSPPIYLDSLSLSQELACVFLLVDARLPAQASDVEVLQAFQHMDLPHVVVATKVRGG